jgi:hypothetical protein
MSELPLLTALCVLLSTFLTPCHCAERVDVRELLTQRLRQKRDVTSDSMTSFRRKRDGEGVPMSEMKEALALDDDANVDVIQTTSSAQGTQIVKLQERYRGERNILSCIH